MSSYERFEGSEILGISVQSLKYIKQIIAIDFDKPVKRFDLQNSGGLIHKLKIKLNCKVRTPDAMVKLAGREKSRCWCWHGERKEVSSTEDGVEQRKLNLKTFLKGEGTNELRIQ